MSAATATLAQPKAGAAQGMTLAELQRAMRAGDKRHAVALLVHNTGVTRAWAMRHATRLVSCGLIDMHKALEDAAPNFRRHLRTLDPTGDTAARNVDMERAGVIAR